MSLIRPWKHLLFGIVFVSLFFIQTAFAQNESHFERVLAVNNEGYSLEDTNAVLPDNLPTFGIEDEKDPVRAFESVLLNYVINPIFLLSGGVAVVVILYSSFLIITSRAQEDSLTSAKTTLIWAFAGLALIILAYTIVSNLARIILEVL